MKVLWFIIGVLAPFASAELVVTVTPEIVLPGVTQSFSLNCALLENEEAKIVSMTISRRTGAQNNLQSGLAETVVTLSSVTPGIPQVSAGYEGLTVLGQITSLESELGSYLNLVWPSPTVEDLGQYTCEAVVIGEMGMLTSIIASAWVTTADPMTDRILLVISQLENRLDSFNLTLQTLEERVDNITAAQAEAEPVALVPATEVSNVTDLVDDVNVTTTTPAPAEKRTQHSKATSLERLASALENVNRKLDQFESSMANFESKLDAIRDRAEQVNRTNPEEFNNVDTFFTYNNSIFFLVSSPSAFSSYSAQAQCEKLGLYLAEVEDSDELQFIKDNAESYILGDSILLVGGRRAAGSSVWRYQNSETQVSFFGDAIFSEAVTKDATCLALQPTAACFAFKDVVCSETQPTAFVLCEDELPEAIKKPQVTV